MSPKTEEYTNAGTEPKTEKITLTIWTPEGDQSGSHGSWLEKELAAFKEAHPEWDLTIKTGVCQEADFVWKIEQNPGTAPDVFMYTNDQIPDLLSMNLLEELSGSTLEQVRQQNSAAMLNTVTFNGAVYGVPYAGNTWLMYYDKRVFSNDDIKNIDTMLERGKVGFPLSSPWYIHSFYAANGCTLFGENGDDLGAGFDFGGDKAAEVTDYFVDLAAIPNFIDTSLYSLAEMPENTVSCIFSGEYDYYSMIDEFGEENLGVSVIPAFTLNGRQVQMKAFAGSRAIGINPDSGYPEAAEALAAFLGSTQAQQDHYDLCNILPADINLAMDDPLAIAQMNTLKYASVVQPVHEEMNHYWPVMGEMGMSISEGFVTHANAVQKTEELNDNLNEGIQYSQAENNQQSGNNNVKTRIIAGTEGGTWLPWNYIDDNGQLSGFDIEIAGMIAEYNGFELMFSGYSYDNLFSALEAGDIDLIINGIGYTDERAEKYEMSIPYGETKFGDQVCIVAKKGKIELIEAVNAALADLKESGRLAELTYQYFQNEYVY